MTYTSDAKCLAIFGCTHEQYASIPKDARTKYKSQRSAAGRRNVEWRFTLWTWWTTWQSSGLWDKRGLAGYVMTRIKDQGPYAPENVRIRTVRDNTQEYWGHTDREARRLQFRAAMSARKQAEATR